jgi:hypothetical protein
MPIFSRPAGIASDGYAERSGGGLRSLYVPMHEWRDVSVERTDAQGRSLVVRPTDPTSRVCPIGFTEMNPRGNKRQFRFTAVYFGGTTIEAAIPGTVGAVVDSIQVTVIPPAPVVARKAMKLGRNGPIPVDLQPKLRQALDAAWKLSKKPGFVESFRSAVSKLSGTEQRSSIYAESLNRIVFNLLDTTSDARVRRGLEVEQQDVLDEAVSGVAPSYSFRNEPNVWIRKSAFDAGIEQLTSCIFHEAAHVAGARGDPLAEFSLDTVHEAAGLKR